MESNCRHVTRDGYLFSGNLSAVTVIFDIFFAIFNKKFGQTEFLSALLNISQSIIFKYSQKYVFYCLFEHTCVSRDAYLIVTAIRYSRV